VRARSPAPRLSATVAAYFARRLLLVVPTLIGITLAVFCITRLVPGGPIDEVLRELHTESGGESAAASALFVGGRVDIPDELLDALRAHYRLDQPVLTAYTAWLGDLVRLDLGVSYEYSVPVLDLITDRFPISIYFGLAGFCLAYTICIPLGILKAVRNGSRFDAWTSVAVFIGYSIPGWALGALLLILLGGGSFWDLVPLGGFRSAGWQELSAVDKVLDQLHHTLVPVLAYAAGSFASLTVLTKNALLENLGCAYVRAARARGLSRRRSVVTHALRNSLIPLCTGLGSVLGVLMAGSYLIERVFNIHGIGYLGYSSLVDRDYAVVMGILVFNTLLALTGNILSDLLYARADPRVRFD